jgi:hypothetical protein
MDHDYSWTLITNVDFVMFPGSQGMHIYAEAIVIDDQPREIDDIYGDFFKNMGPDRHITGLTYGCIRVFSLGLNPDTSLKIEAIHPETLVKFPLEEPVFIWTPGLDVTAGGKNLDVMCMHSDKPIRIERIDHFPHLNELDNLFLKYSEGRMTSDYPQVTWKNQFRKS